MPRSEQRHQAIGHLLGVVLVEPLDDEEVDDLPIALLVLLEGSTGEVLVVVRVVGAGVEDVPGFLEDVLAVGELGLLLHHMEPGDFVDIAFGGAEELSKRKGTMMGWY